MTTVAIVSHSGYGHTARLAQEIAAGVTAAGAQARLLTIESASQDFQPLLDGVADADAVIFGAPTYMGDVSAAFRAFAEASSKPLSQGLWADKLAAGFTNSHSYAGDKLQALQSLCILAAQHGMVWVSLGVPPPAVPAAERGPETLNVGGHFLGLGGQSDNAAVEQSQTSGEHETARRFGRRVALAAQRWVAGKAAAESVREAA